MAYRTKQVSIDALQFTNEGDNRAAAIAFCGAALSKADDTELVLTASDGRFVRVQMGQWIVKLPGGECFPVSANAFAVFCESV